MLQSFPWLCSFQCSDTGGELGDDGLLFFDCCNQQGNCVGILQNQITVTENGIVLYREATRIMEDGNELSKTYHRSSLTPGQDLTGIPANVVAHCNVAWTAEVVAAYQAQVAAQTQGA